MRVARGGGPVAGYTSSLGIAPPAGRDGGVVPGGPLPRVPGMCGPFFMLFFVLGFPLVVCVSRLMGPATLPGVSVSFGTSPRCMGKQCLLLRTEDIGAFSSRGALFGMTSFSVQATTVSPFSAVN